MFSVSNQALSSQALGWFFSPSLALSNILHGAEEAESNPEHRFLHVTREY